MTEPTTIEGTVWFLVKLLVFLYMYIWLRATLPRLRYDQLMDLAAYEKHLETAEPD